MYSLASLGAAGAVLSWLEPSGRGRAFRFSSYTRGRWSAPRTIAEGDDLFSNWADHPSIAATSDGALVAQWPVINPGKPVPGSYNNSIRVAVSRDRGVTWKEVFADGLDNIHSYSGFVSLLPGRAGFNAVYLTPPRPVSHDPADHTMTLSHVSVDGPAGRPVQRSSTATRAAVVPPPSPPPAMARWRRIAITSPARSGTSPSSVWSRAPGRRHGPFIATGGRLPVARPTARSSRLRADISPRPGSQPQVTCLG